MKKLLMQRTCSSSSSAGGKLNKEAEQKELSAYQVRGALSQIAKMKLLLSTSSLGMAEGSY